MFLLTREQAWMNAAHCAAQAGLACDEGTRLLFLRMRDRWIRIANNPGIFELPAVSVHSPAIGVEPGDSEAA